MLTSVPGALVKNTLKDNFCIGKHTFYILKRMITQVPMLNYYIKFPNLEHYLGFSLFKILFSHLIAGGPIVPCYVFALVCVDLTIF
jgi:hypothetical protein